jgi:hypothetical protein
MGQRPVWCWCLGFFEFGIWVPDASDPATCFVNASLNALSTVFSRRLRLHQAKETERPPQLLIAAFITSTIFLGCYSRITTFLQNDRLARKPFGAGVVATVTISFSDARPARQTDCAAHLVVESRPQATLEATKDCALDLAALDVCLGHEASSFT